MTTKGQFRRPSGPLGYRDFDGFGRWYTTSRYRKTGRAASPHTLRTKQIHLAQAANLLGAVEEVFLGSSLGDRQKVEDFLNALACQMTPGAMRSVVYALLSYADYAKAKGWVTVPAITTRDVPPRNPDPGITVYSEVELRTFVDAARGVDLRWWAFLAFLVDSGRRVGEALSLEWGWLRQDSRPAYFELPTTKNGDAQYIPLTARLADDVFSGAHMATLRSDARTGRKAFTRDPAKFVFPWRYTTVFARFGRFCDRTGLPNRGFHNFRHTVITDRLARGVPLQAVAALAGHRSVSTTDRRYNHTNALHYAKYVEMGVPSCGS